jgi:glycosyltransferase involved in cell wall biosynthesis
VTRKEAGRATGQAKVAIRIAQVAGPWEAVPPEGYGGTERVIDALVAELVARGHQVTTFAPGGSNVAGDVVVTVDEALRLTGFSRPADGFMLETALRVLDDADRFDLIHSHLEWAGMFLGRATRTPVVHTCHGRVDMPWAEGVMQRCGGALVAISEHQASTQPNVRWAGVVHNGLNLSTLPWRAEAGDDLCFVGRVAPEKGILDAVEVAARCGRKLRVAAKIGPEPADQEYYRSIVKPAFDRDGVEYLGELGTEDRSRLVSESYASLVTGAWPEPFGLVVIESLACGTPVIGRRVGALPEIIREGQDGFFGDDVHHLAFLTGRVSELDRTAIRRSVLDRFSAERMADGYEAIYERQLSRVS